MKQWLTIILLIVFSNFSKSQEINRCCFDFPLTVEIIDSAEYADNINLIKNQIGSSKIHNCFDKKLGYFAKLEEVENVQMKMLCSRNEDKIVMIVTKDNIDYFMTIPKSVLIPDLVENNEILETIKNATVVDTSDKKNICGIECYKVKFSVPGLPIIASYVNNKLHLNQFMLGYIPKEFHESSVLEIEYDYGYAKFKRVAQNFIAENIPDSIFIVDTLKIRPLSELQVNTANEINVEEEIIPGEGIGLDVYNQMVIDSIIPSYEYIEINEKKASIDISCLLTYLDVDKDGNRRPLSEIDSLIQVYNIVEYHLINEFHKWFKGLDIHDFQYGILLKDYIGLKKLKDKKYKENLVANIYFDGYQFKEEDNTLNDEKFINGEISFSDYLATIKGIYKMYNGNYIYSKNELKNVLSQLIKEIEPNLHVYEFEFIGDSIKLVLKSNYEFLTYYSNIGEYINYQYTDEGERKNNKIDTIDIYSYIEYEFINMFKQIGADLNLNKIYKFLKKEDILSNTIFSYDGMKNNIEFQVMDTPLLVSIDKETSSERFFTTINYSFKNEKGEIGMTYALNSFYNADPGIDYVSIHKKRDIVSFLKTHMIDLKLKDDEIVRFENNINNRLFENVSDIITNIPQLGIFMDDLFKLTVPKLSGEEKLKDIFSNIYKLLENDFEATNFKIEMGKNEIEYILTFDAYGQKYSIQATPNKLEIEMLKKIGQIMSQKNLYRAKNLYYEYTFSLLTLKVFYITKETKKELEQLFDIELIPLK